MIPYSRQSISKKDLKVVRNVLKSRLITQGPFIERFEKTITKSVKCKYGTAVNSATSGLHIACLALGLNSDHYLWTVPNTYVSSANCGRFCGAKIDFVDIDPETLNISLDKLKRKLFISKNKKKLPKILVVVHLAGNPVDMLEIKKLSKKYKFKIIEDASHALGSKINNIPIGSCKFSDITVFSFHPVKIITTGEGGMVLTNSKEIKIRLDILRNNGTTRNKRLFIQKNFQPWKYEMQLLGYNYRMTDIQAALGISQFSQHKKFVKKRNEIAALYKKKLNNNLIEFQKLKKGNFSSYHLMVILLKIKKLKKTYKKIFSEILKNKIGINLHYFPVHLQPYYLKHCGRLKLKNSENYAQRAISIPIYYDLKKKDQILVINKLNKIIY
tara:strand:- start:332 stop:1486 length:1155 start_codon:yes stop_codon:yes gene_type:complete